MCGKCCFCFTGPKTSFTCVQCPSCIIMGIQIRILHLIKVCESATTSLNMQHASTYCERPRPSISVFWAPKAPESQILVHLSLLCRSETGSSFSRFRIRIQLTKIRIRIRIKIRVANQLFLTRQVLPQILGYCSNPGSFRLPSAATAGTSLPGKIETALKGLPYEISVSVLWPKIESGHFARWALRHLPVEIVWSPFISFADWLHPPPPAPQQASHNGYTFLFSLIVFRFSVGRYRYCQKKSRRGRGEGITDWTCTWTSSCAERFCIFFRELRLSSVSAPAQVKI